MRGIRALRRRSAALPRRETPRGRPPPGLRVQGLGVAYGRTPALRDVWMEIPAGRVTALVGPSGCGKSSLLAALNRLTELVEGARLEGRVLLDGSDLRSRRDTVALRREIGMIFQSPNPFPTSIRRNLDLPLREHGVRLREERDAAIEEALRDVGLWEEVKDRLGEAARGLSGGQQQRLCLARALALRPRVLLLDEPCSALDPLAAEVVEKRIERLRGEYTVVVVTHNLAQARRIADHLAVFWLRGEAGTCIEEGPADRVFGDPRDPDARAYLGGRRG